MPTDVAVKPGRVDVLGVGISAVSLTGATDRIMQWVHDREHHYVCVTNVHTVMECQRDEELRRIHNASGMTTPDGMTARVGGAQSAVRCGRCHPRVRTRLR